MNHDRPLISIITVVYNAASSLELAIRSVLSQQQDLFEYWIIDGGSTDGSLEIIRKYESCLAGWISEPDTGIYDAMNKGIDRASGQWLYFLGADDQLTDGILARIAPYLQTPLAAVYGNVQYDNGHIMHSHIDIRTLLHNTLHHQGTFYNHRLFSNFRYNTIYRVISDYELNLIIYKTNQLTKSVPFIIATCGSSGISSVLSSTEVNTLRGKYISNKLINFSLSTILNLYYLYFRTKMKVLTKIRKKNYVEESI